jgi:hypothetical protein
MLELTQFNKNYLYLNNQYYHVTGINSCLEELPSRFENILIEQKTK